MHSGAETSTRVEIVWVDAEELERSPFSQRLKLLRDVHGIVVPGGFGKRGTEGKIIAIRHAREHKIPFLGICLGFQLGVVEFARHILKFTGANSTEFDPGTKYPVIDLLPEQQDIEAKGATMRLGAKPTLITKGSIAYSLYGRTAISERHRHRYEVNPKYIDVLEAEGLKFSGRSPDGRLMEIGELPESRHPYFMLCQFHPEFKSRPGKPAPLYLGLVKAAIAYAEQRGD
jgi:CTP synthase